MHFVRPVPLRTTKATVPCGSSLCRLVTSLAAAPTAALVAEPASWSAGRLVLPHEWSPRLARGLFYFVQQSAKSGARLHFDAVATSDSALDSVTLAHGAEPRTETRTATSAVPRSSLSMLLWRVARQSALGRDDHAVRVTVAARSPSV